MLCYSSCSRYSCHEFDISILYLDIVIAKEQKGNLAKIQKCIDSGYSIYYDTKKEVI